MTISIHEFDAPFIDIFDFELMNDPAKMGAALGDNWVAKTMFGPLITQHSDVQALLRDRRLRTPQGLGLELQGITTGPLYDRVVSGILSLDGDDHGRLRRIVNSAFNPKSADALRPFMQSVINELADPICAKGEGDFVAEVTTQYPIPIICKLLGAPREDWEFFSRITDQIFRIFSFDVAAHQDSILASFIELDTYVEAMVQRRRTDPQDDLITRLIRAEESGDKLSLTELKMMVEATLTAGTDTTRNQLAAAIELFAKHPDQWAMLAANPELAAGAVDEVMRHTPVIPGTFRVTKEDVELHEVLFPTGTMMSLLTSRANLDDRVHDRPLEFDITRPQKMPHLTFGGGAHYCLGVNLAKAELQEALTVLPRRMPHLALTGEVVWKRNVGIDGPLNLPISFEHGH